MITEDYVSFETAKLLKEKGFDGKCHLSQDCVETKYEEGGDWISETTTTIGIPTLQMTMKWLREVHKLYMYTAFSGMEEVWFSRIYDNDKHLKDLDDFNTYEEACEEAIKYCLENLI